MAVSFKSTTATSDPLFPLVYLGPAYANFAALPDPATLPNRLVAVAANTSPGSACLAISDGVSWFPISISGTPVS